MRPDKADRFLFRARTRIMCINKAVNGMQEQNFTGQDIRKLYTICGCAKNPKEKWYWILAAAEALLLAGALIVFVRTHNPVALAALIVLLVLLLLELFLYRTDWKLYRLKRKAIDQLEIPFDVRFEESTLQYKRKDLPASKILRAIRIADFCFLITRREKHWEEPVYILKDTPEIEDSLQAFLNRNHIPEEKQEGRLQLDEKTV